MNSTPPDHTLRVLDDRILSGIGLSRTHVRGRKPRLGDAELLCPVVARHLLQFDSETRCLRQSWSGGCQAPGYGPLAELLPGIRAQSNEKVPVAPHVDLA